MFLHAVLTFNYDRDILPKLFGVLNFESECVGAFSTFDQECAEVIARHLARTIERIEFDQKLNGLRTVEKQIAAKHDWDSKVDLIVEAIQDRLEYHYVNISLVEPDLALIRSVRVHGLTEPERFLSESVHRLDSKDIEADIVRNNRIEVVQPEDIRNDEKLLDSHRMRHLIRVFVPMYSPALKAVLGTVSAGYYKTVRPSIYERDVQILKGFVDYATAALDQTRRGTIDRISHELNAPITAVSANVSFLSRRWKELSEQRIALKLEDIQTDIDILGYQAQQLEYILGGAAVHERGLQLEWVLLFRDIILKTILQLTGVVREKGFDPTRVGYDENVFQKIGQLYVDRAKVAQVVFNLFMNALKYAENVDSFKIHVGADVTDENCLVRFQDWGVGIEPIYAEKIFEEGFRAPSAMAKQSVTGSGFGLFIARRIMREHGGDIALTNPRKPTEFQLRFPKRDRFPKGLS